MTAQLATQIDRQAELAIVEATRGQLPLESALLTASLALTAWSELGEEYWPERRYWEETISRANRLGKLD